MKFRVWKVEFRMKDFDGLELYCETLFKARSLKECQNHFLRRFAYVADRCIVDKFIDTGVMA